jgi:hypothetical protein
MNNFVANFFFRLKRKFSFLVFWISFASRIFLKSRISYFNLIQKWNSFVSKYLHRSFSQNLENAFEEDEKKSQNLESIPPESRVIFTDVIFHIEKNISSSSGEGPKSSIQYLSQPFYEEEEINLNNDNIPQNIEDELISQHKEPSQSIEKVLSSTSQHKEPSRSNEKMLSSTSQHKEPYSINNSSYLFLSSDPDFIPRLQVISSSSPQFQANETKSNQLSSKVHSTTVSSHLLHNDMSKQRKIPTEVKTINSDILPFLDHNNTFQLSMTQEKL